MPANISFNAKLTTAAGSRIERVTLDTAIVGGWSGRDMEALQHHIDELAKIGVKPPDKTPMFYRVGVSRLLVADQIQVIGDGSSGEVEYVLMQHRGELWVGAGSDHTDRVFEHMGITVAKQLCDKPLASEFWPLSEVEDHWDRLRLFAVILENGEDVVYQDGSVSGLLSPTEMLRHLAEDGGAMADGVLLFGGTCGATGDVRFSPQFRFELVDPVLDRTIRHCYEVMPVPIKG